MSAVWPDPTNVTTSEPAWGPTGVEYAGLLDMDLFTVKNGVVAAADVRKNIPLWSGAEVFGTCEIPDQCDVRFGTPVDGTTGTCVVPLPDDVREGAELGNGGSGRLIVPAAADLRLGSHAGWHHPAGKNGNPPESWEVTGEYAPASGGGTAAVFSG